MGTENPTRRVGRPPRRLWRAPCPRRPAGANLPPMTTTELRTHLIELEAERAVAIAAGVATLELYMNDLEQEIPTTRKAYVTSVLTEIASFRSELSDPQLG